MIHTYKDDEVEKPNKDFDHIRTAAQHHFRSWVIIRTEMQKKADLKEKNTKWSWATAEA